MEDESQESSENPKNLTNKVMSETLWGLEKLLAGSELFEGYAYPYRDKPRGNILTVNGPEGFFFQSYISEIIDPEDQQKILLPYLASIVIPERHYKKGWGTKIVSVWENALINSGYEGLIFAKSVGVDARGFWSKLGYSHYDLNDWAKKI